MLHYCHHLLSCNEQLELEPGRSREPDGLRARKPGRRHSARPPRVSQIPKKKRTETALAWRLLQPLCTEDEGVDMNTAMLMKSV